MKRLSLLILAVLFCVSSCKKSADTTSASTITATIDGVTESFNTITIASLSTGVQPNSNLTISGSDGTTTGSNSLSLNIGSNSTITKGVYTNAATSSGSTSILCSFGPYSLTKPNSYTTDPYGKYPGTITITSLSSTNIQGTFSGQLALSGGSTVKTITDGKFNINLR